MDYKERSLFLEERINRLNEIGIALSTESNTNKLFEMILEEARHITHADGRTLYMKDADGNLKFEIMITDSKGTYMGGTSGIDIPIPPIPLEKDGKPNHSHVCAHVAITGESSNIEDAYENKEFDFSGTKAFDGGNDYRSQSFLTVPLKNHENDIIGVMQLLNAIDVKTGETIPFSNEMESQIISLASQGAVALTNKRLVEELKTLFESFIRLIATAIDKKSEYTGGHCERVPEITMMLADAVENTKEGTYKDFSMTEDERYELFIAAWLHDCGKVATPVHVVDKATKLETIYDRVENVQTRFEILKRDIEIEFLNTKLTLLEKGDIDGIKDAEAKLNLQLAQFDDDLAFVEKSNVGGEFMQDADQDRIRQIGDYKWTYKGETKPFLSELEVRNLTIAKGTLLPEEREIINDHIVITIDMLEKLPYPKNLKNVPEFAGGHHETLDGKGYPKGLTGDQMSVQAKMMAIADIYEALTASDRPYKDGKKLSHAMRIMGFMRNDYHIDEELFEIFVKEGVYKKYATKYLADSQLDEVDESSVLN
ncbi:MAG: GAF domain-containing protein [Candidatus Marinimicrobia bacterium]|nr:GAF domain-containing protein [Candidatus Neomarinimicrobiota bacterium]